MIERLCVIGVGLIGGSVARAARAAGLCRTVAGVDACAANLAKAKELGVIDEAYGEIGSGAAGADWVVIATPVGAVSEVFAALKPIWADSAVYTDAGSTKQDVVAAVRSVFGQMPANFVPGHPIAGAERSGVAAASADLYRGKRVILTPVVGVSDAAAVEWVTAFWERLGARVSCMDPVHHDEVLAATSHLPHVLAFALTHMLGRQDEQQEIFRYAAGGFRDFTRIASSDPRMWRDICVANRDQIVAQLHRYGEELVQLAALLERADAAALFDYFTEAREARQRFLDQLETPP